MLSVLSKDLLIATILDSMADGQWHSMSKILKNNAQIIKEHIVEDEKSDVLRKMFTEIASDGHLLLGENNSQRFTVDSLMEWRNIRGMENQPSTITSPRFFGNVLEDDGWQHAPLRAYDVIHFRGTGEVTERRIQKLIGSRGFVTKDTDGLYRIMSLYGDEIFIELKEWSKRNNLDVSGARLDKNTMRREISELPPRFFDDLCVFYGVFSHTLLRKNMSSVKRHIPDSDDIQQQIYLWIIDAVQRYKHETCIPFAAYLSQSLNSWVHDLGRKTYGRSISDNELKLSRAIASFETEHNRTPTHKELARIMNESETQIKQKINSVSIVNNIRNMTTLDSEDFDIPIAVHDTPSTIEDLNQSLISANLTSAAVVSQANPVAWLDLYHSTWGSRKHASVSVMTGVDNHIIEEGKERISTLMRENLQGEVI